jgi:hypothetical protein
VNRMVPNKGKDLAFVPSRTRVVVTARQINPA